MGSGAGGHRTGHPAAGQVIRMEIGAHRDLIQIRESDHILGAAEPELTLIEYGDFGCPFCFVGWKNRNQMLFVCKN